MRKTAVTRRKQVTKGGPCRHHWLIESPQGRTSMGMCKLCGAQKEFSNSTGDFLWESEPLAELSYGRWGKSRELHAPTGKGADDSASTTGTGVAGSTRLA
jgi:hypothetical protein